jgi:hypothetical protein
MAKAPTALTAQERVILFCAATGIDHAAVGILAHAMNRGASLPRGVGSHGKVSDIWRRSLLHVLC